jgi:GreA/GreB family transcription elongation factor
MLSLRQALADCSGRDLRYWTSRRATARILPDPTDRSEVRFGTAVTIMRDDGREQTFRMVGEDETDPSRRSISHDGAGSRATVWTIAQAVLLVMAVGSIVGTFIGGLLLGLIPNYILLPVLAALLLLSAVTIWRHG